LKIVNPQLNIVLRYKSATFRFVKDKMQDPTKLRKVRNDKLPTCNIFFACCHADAGGISEILKIMLLRMVSHSSIMYQQYKSDSFLFFHWKKRNEQICDCNDDAMKNRGRKQKNYFLIKQRRRVPNFFF
jgi:hypothetical protein